MGRRAVDLTNPVPALGLPALVGVQSWKTGSCKRVGAPSSQKWGPPCSVGVQTSPALQAMPSLKRRSLTEAQTDLSGSCGMHLGNAEVTEREKQDGKREVIRGVAPKGRSLCKAVSTEREGVAFEKAANGTQELLPPDSQGGTRGDVKDNKTNQQPSRGLVTGRRGYRFSNGSVVAPEVMGVVYSEGSEWVEPAACMTTHISRDRVSTITRRKAAVHCGYAQSCRRSTPCSTSCIRRVAPCRDPSLTVNCLEHARPTTQPQTHTHPSPTTHPHTHTHPTPILHPHKHTHSTPTTYPYTHTETHSKPTPPPQTHTETHSKYTPPPQTHTETHYKPAPPHQTHTKTYSKPVPPSRTHTETHSKPAPPPQTHTETHSKPAPCPHRQAETHSKCAPPSCTHTETPSKPTPPLQTHTETDSKPPPSRVHTTAHSKWTDSTPTASSRAPGRGTRSHPPHGHPPNSVPSACPSPSPQRLCCRLQRVAQSVQDNQHKISTLLNIIQHLETSSLRQGRCSSTGRNVSVCQETACIIYRVEHDFRQQERSFMRVLQNLPQPLPFYPAATKAKDLKNGNKIKNAKNRVKQLCGKCFRGL